MTIIEKVQRKFRIERSITALIVILSVSVSLLIVVNEFSNLSDIALGALILLIAGVLTIIYYRAGSFSLPPESTITRFLDRNYPMFEDSSGLYLQKDLNTLEQLQIRRISDNLASSKEDIKLPGKRHSRTVLLSVLLLTVSILLTWVPDQLDDRVMVTGNSLNPIDEQSAAIDEPGIPAISSIQIFIEPPAYTGLTDRVVMAGSVTATASSQLSWNVKIDGAVDQAAIVFNDRNQVELLPDGETFSASMTAENRYIYRIKASTDDTTVYSSYHSIDVMEDRPPQFRIDTPGEFRTLLTETNREIEMSVEIRDDFAVMEAGLNATLARGSGESVRFREQRMAFDQLDGLGTNRVTASILLHADSLQLTPGDELYLHATATDNHPDAQTARSETYMIVLEDTTRSQPILAGNIQIDLMPEDFRSQRQIIVDTEELIEEKDRVSDGQFRIRSRRIGRDQEMLMLDFGHYLGMEEESVLVSGVMEDGAEANDHDHGHSHGHDHGHEGETGTPEAEPELDGEGQETTKSTSASMIPDEFLHDHGSPEMNTLFADSPRALLTRALNEMFQASRYLLMDQPEEALAFEYRALEFLQQAQQADRRYVRRAGLDGIPIPVDEDRLTGDVDDFADPTQRYRSTRVVPPLVRIEQSLRMGLAMSEEAVTDAKDVIRGAEITEADKLYLLNRVDRLNEPARAPMAREQMLMKLSEIHTAMPRNPAPLRVPSIKKTIGSR